MKKIAAITLALSATLATGLQAGDLPAGWTSYDAGKFAAAVKTSQTMVVDVHADWCPTCRAQAPILQELRRDEQLKSVRFVRVDWDKDKDFVRISDGTQTMCNYETRAVFEERRQTVLDKSL